MHGISRFVKNKAAYKSEGERGHLNKEVKMSAVKKNSVMRTKGELERLSERESRIKQPLTIRKESVCSTTENS